MNKEDFPYIYQSADSLSLKAQKHFFRVLFFHLLFLVIGALLSFIDNTWAVIFQSIILLLALGCSVYLFWQRPDKNWYAGRAVAESIKTLTWRYICRAEPFCIEDNKDKSEFRNKLKQILEQNKQISQKLIGELNCSIITDKMEEIRSYSLKKRIDYYRKNRIKEQLTWYHKKANFNKKMAKLFFWLLIIFNALSLILSILNITCHNILPTDLTIAIASGILTWIQAKRFTELSASYSLTAHEISFINEQSEAFNDDDLFSSFVGDAENAFSREHTQWIARRDV
ncbi:DUF4231 domain-containing protein [Avibacterium avium]|uniref:DUF4231 domain-containing protein n=1 Tax=Avibacterium avium TaxID=751 RepID=UPI003BF84AEE